MCDLCFTPRQKKILQFLLTQKGWVKGGTIAAVLGVTTRTVRNDVKGINQIGKNGDVWIESSHTKGYCARENAAQISGVPDRNSAPILPKERLNYILRKLILAKETIDFFVLAEELLISESTLESDLKRIKTYLQENAAAVVLQRKTELLELSGSEREKRALFSKLILAEAEGSFFNLSNYEQYFPQINKIRQIVSAVLKEYDYTLNEFGLMNLMVHIAITLDRIAHANLLVPSARPKADTTEFRIAEALCQDFKAAFGVDFPMQEKIYLSHLILIKKRIKNTYHNRAELTAILAPRFVEITEAMVEAVQQEFGLDLKEDETLFVGLSLHLSALHERMQQQAMLHNPLLHDLKRRYPFIFEIAVFMASCFYHKTGFMIHEDEIGYLCLHLGAALERLYERTAVKKKVALVCPSGSTSTEILLSKLQAIYQNKIVIAGVYSFLELEELVAKKPDFIFSTVNFAHALNIPTIQISPFLDLADIDVINKNLHLLENTAKKQKLQVDMEQYFDEELFYCNPKIENRFNLIEFMSNELKVRHIVPEEYMDSVLKREQISSTSFNHLIAIPHAVEMCARKTAISVAKFDKPILWGEHKVQLVLLFAIKAGERKKMRDLYQYILNIIDKQEGVLYLIKAENCAQFKERILNWIDTN